MNLVNMSRLSTAATLPFFLLLLIGSSRANNNLQLVYQWQQIDFKYNTDADRLNAVENKAFIPENVIPAGIEVVNDRLFLTFPRLRPGVPVSLASIKLNDLTTQSPQLTPYPSWEAHTTLSPNEVSEIVSPYHIKADRCGHLWVLDSGVDGEINSKKSKRLAPTRILGYDLRNDNLIQNYEIPAEQFFNQTSILSNIAVEDNDCENIFVYLADSGEPGLIVYSVKEKESWRVKHHFFHPDPLAGNFSITGIKFQTADGLYGLALSEKRPNGFADLYFHPFSSTNEFKVSTEVLRNRTKIANEAYYKDFQLIGSRGSNGQSATSVLDQSTGVIFYAMLNLNRISCWKTSSKKNYTINDGNVFSDPISMVYPSDLKIDDKGRLWVLSNNMQQFLYGELDHKIVNFRILRGPVKEAIKGTACDETAWDIANKAIKKVGDKLLPGTKTDKNHSNAIQPVAFTITFIALLLFVKQQL